MTYSGKDTAGQAPSFQQGTPLPAQFLDERGLHKTQIQDSSGDPKKVLKGHAPTRPGQRGHGRHAHRDRQGRPGPGRGALQERDERRSIRSACYRPGSLHRGTDDQGIRGRIRRPRSSSSRPRTCGTIPISSWKPIPGLATTPAGRREVLMDLIDKGLFGDIKTAPISLRQELLRSVRPFRLHRPNQRRLRAGRAGEFQDNRRPV